MNDSRKVYDTSNVAHWFSRNMTFPEWLNGLSKSEEDKLKIDDNDYEKFMLYKDTEDTPTYCHIPMPVHFIIKHRHQGKIESQKWFFKGFCEYMEPKYVQTIDVGSIPIRNSISRIIKYMDQNK